MARFFVYSLALATCAILVSSEKAINQTLPLNITQGNVSHPQQNASIIRIAREGTKDLKLTVTKHGDATEQVVDNQQGQVVKQTVEPEGIRQTVFRNGQKITDDIVPRPTPSRPSS